MSYVKIVFIIDVTLICFSVCSIGQYRMSITVQSTTEASVEPWYFDIEVIPTKVVHGGEAALITLLGT